MSRSPPRLWHALVCCDNDHGSSSSASMNAGAGTGANTSAGNTPRSLMPTAMANSLSSSSSASAAASTSLSSSFSSAPSQTGPEPCPFETYCCLDEHCEADCKKSAALAQCDDKCASSAECAAEACFDPTCDDGCEAECCDDPSCEAEWCFEGCTIEEYLECCASACNDPNTDPLGLASGPAAPLPTPPYFDLISAALAGQLGTAPPPPPVVAPSFSQHHGHVCHGQHVCHWQNCHRAFTTMQELLTHLAADHLNASVGGATFGTDTSAAAGAGANTGSTTAVSSAHHTPAAHATPVSQPTPQTPIMMGFENMAPAQSMAPAPAQPASTGDLLSCLWDDCFPLDGLGVLDLTGNNVPQLQGHSHAHQHAHVQSQAQSQHVAQPHAAAHLHIPAHPFGPAATEAFSPQTMLRHLLEEHLGVVPAMPQVAAPTPAPAAFDSTPAPASHNGHPHAGHSAHDHVHVHDGHEHTHPHGHAHAHPHAHTPRPKPYSRPASASRGAAHTHAHPHPHAHSHKHGGHGPQRTPAHHHHVKFPLSPAPSSPVTTSSDLAMVCLWPGCTHKEPFATTGDLMEHLSEEHVGRGRDKYRCLWDGCGGPEGRLFRSRQKVLRHLQSHTGHRPFVCHVCGQSFSEAAPLAAHLRRHSDDKPYVCDFPGCGKAFAISSSLTIHKRTHNGDKPFVCTYCGKGFVEASNLTKHVRTHTGERPFVCAHPGCGRAFSRPDQLKRHMLVHDASRRKKETVKKEAVAV